MTAAADFRPLSLCVLTVSDTRSADNDTSGAYLSDALRDAGHRLFERAIVRDDKYAMRALVSRWIADGEVDGILVTGGTGFTGRDSTPEALLPLLDKHMDGFGELFRALSFEEIGTSTLQSRASGALAAAHRRRLVVVIEGRDTAGKGGASSRHRRHAEPAPVPRGGAAQAQRARAHAVVLPALRAAPAGRRRDRAVRPQLVQPRRRRAVMGFCTEAQAQAFLNQAPCSRRCWSTTASCCSSTGSRSTRPAGERFAERLADPLKRWKLSPIDLQAREKYADYTARATPCSRPPTRAMRPGRWWTSTTSGAAGWR
jgi:molybdenum cofactor biosynthesis protein B